MLDINRILKSNRQMKALTGMNIIEFELLVPRIDDSISLKILSKKVRKRKVQSLQDRTYALLCKNSIWSAPHLHLKIL